MFLLDVYILKEFRLSLENTKTNENVKWVLVCTSSGGS